MGDRAIVHFTDRDRREVGPAVYLHWSGSAVPGLLRELRTLMTGREGDKEYATARFVGLCHVHIPGNLSLGTWNAPEDGRLGAVLSASYSHGDFGVVVVDTATWQVYTQGGYGFEDGREDWRPMPEPAD